MKGKIYVHCFNIFVKNRKKYKSLHIKLYTDYLVRGDYSSLFESLHQ